MDALGLSGWNLAFQFVNFLIFLWLMHRLLFKPISEMLRSRRDRIGASLREADDLRARVDQERAEFQSELSDARDEAQRIRDEAARSAEVLRAQALDRAREDSERLRNDALAEIDRSRDQVREEIRNETADLVLGATARVLNRSVSDSEHRRLVEEALSELQGDRT